MAPQMTVLRNPDRGFHQEVLSSVEDSKDLLIYCENGVSLIQSSVLLFALSSKYMGKVMADILSLWT